MSKKPRQMHKSHGLETAAPSSEVRETFRLTVGTVGDVPVYGSDTAIGLLVDMARSIEGGASVLQVSREDAAAIRWALRRIGAQVN